MHKIDEIDKVELGMKVASGVAFTSAVAGVLSNNDKVQGKALKTCILGFICFCALVVFDATD